MNKKNTSLILTVLIMSMLITGIGQASSVDGATGLINIPTASTMTASTASLSYHSFKGGNYASVIVGVAPGVEAGLSARFGDKTNLFGSLKVNLVKELDYPAVSVGLRAGNDQLNYYAVASMQLGAPGVRGHAGIGTGRYSSGFAGLSIVLNPVSVSTTNRKITVPLTTAIFEYDGSGLNAGVLLKFNNSLNGKIYLSDFSSLGFGVNYKF